MMEQRVKQACSNYEENVWKKHTCRNCGSKEGDHTQNTKGPTPEPSPLPDGIKGKPLGHPIKPRPIQTHGPNFYPRNSNVSSCTKSTYCEIIVITSTALKALS